MLKILKNLSPTEIILAIFVMVLTCVQVYLDLKLPDYMSEITLLVQTKGSAIEDIYSAGIGMVLCALGSLLTFGIIAVLAAKVASNFSFTIRKKLFEKVMSFSMKEVSSFSISSLITRMTNDITQVQLIIIFGLRMLIKAPVTAIWAIAKIADKNSSWTMVTAIALIILMCIVAVCLFLVVPKFKKLQVLTDEINRLTRENLEGLNVIRAYNAEEYQANKFSKANQELTSTQLFTARVLSFMMPSIQMVNNGLVLAVYLVGAVIISKASGAEKMTLFSDMVVFFSYAIYVIMSFMLLVRVFMQLPRASISAKRINEVLYTQESMQEGTFTTGIEEKNGEVEFRNVSFKYPDAEEYTLKNISFTAKKGEIVAFIGSTGCGKSTAINLIPRFYDVNEGEVLVNGRNVKDYSKKALNSLIGYVSQKSILFKGTVKSNVLFGDNAGRIENNNALSASIETAQASEFVNNLENQHEAFIAQGGQNLSGGQKQRLSIARAVHRQPEIFIFDDSFSALDYKTDKQLRKALHTDFENSTRLIVGQRISTIKDANKIIVLEDGKIVGIGSHKELLQACEVYKQIALSQLSKEELQHA